KFLADLQKNTYFADVSKPGVSDSAWKGEFRWEPQLFKWRTYVERTGANFVSFSAPGVVGDRLTYDSSFSLFPVSWYTLGLNFDQYHDNVAGSSAKATTTQRAVSTSHTFQFATGTNLSLNGSMTTAKAQPSSVLNNRTTTAGLGVTQSFGGDSVSLSLQNTAFTDALNLAHDLDTNTAALSSTFALPRGKGAAFGVSDSMTKDKTDGSSRSSLSVSPSFSARVSPSWTSQTWGTLSKTKNNSPAFPADSQTMQVNTEFTWTRSASQTLTLGVGYNKNQDKVAGTKLNELLVSTRYSYSF
ncbi:MAG: hypothetical protein KGL53_07985, partial [Elusimicrobia bacterium]|nr:hypothetical protein [Elusimicrobiota bacterium]